MGTLLAMGWQVWRRSADRLQSAAGLAIFCGVLALGIVETVGSFTGVDPRFTALVGGVAGLLAAMRRLRRCGRPSGVAEQRLGALADQRRVVPAAASSRAARPSVRTSAGSAR